MTKPALNRRRFLQLVGVGGVALAATPLTTLAGESDSRACPAAIQPDRIILTHSGDPATTQTVTWRTSVEVARPTAQVAQADGTPYFGDQARDYTPESTLLSGDGWEDRYHQVVFQGLDPDTVYHYRLGSDGNWTEWYQFKTASDQADPFSFIYVGDAQNDIISRWSHVIRRARVQDPDIRFMLHAGDLINHDDSDDEWGEWHAGDGWAQAGIACVATPGNHEYDGINISPQWNHQFAFPDNGPSLKRLKNTVYYMDYQGVRFISLDTTLMSYPVFAGVQRIWLKSVLKNNPNRWTVVFHHHPMKAGAKDRTGHPILNLECRALYNRYNVDLVLQGHDHTYARGNIWTPGEDPGPVYVVSVSGPKMYESDADWADVTGENLQFFQHISLDGKRLKYRAYTSIGEMYDSFDLKKNDDGSSSQIDANA